MLRSIQPSRFFCLLFALTTLILATPLLGAGHPRGVQMAALHPQLVWQRTSTSVEDPAGPVLYQLIFRLPDAQGDVAGKFPNLAVVGLRGIAVSSSVPATGQVLTFNGTQWAPADSAAVGLNGNQTIGGNKTFTGNTSCAI